MAGVRSNTGAVSKLGEGSRLKKTLKLWDSLSIRHLVEGFLQ